MNILSEYRICANLDTKFKLNIKLVFITKRNILIISYDKKVYEFECDKFGTFCSKDYQNGTVIEPKIIEKLNTSDIICFANGLKHIIALNNLGVVYSWGLNNYGQLGFGKRDNDYEEIASIDYFKNRKIAIKKICCGANHSLALSKSGHVFAWGDNEFGQIGNGKDKKPQSEPILLDGFENENILAISCGGQHSLAITQSGCVFSWGSNEFGQLGLEGYEMTNKPQKIVAIRDLIKKITCGAKHSLLLSREGKLFAFGSNEFGQVGEGSKKNIVLPHVIKSRILFKDIAANFEYNISIALSTSDVFYIWGKCGGEIFLEPEETPFKSFDDIFAHYYEITYGLHKPKNKSQSDNGFYEREFNQLEEIDRGSYGVVYKAQKKGKDKGFYAIKITYPLNNEKKNEMLREVEVLWNLKEKYVVRYYNAWLEDHFIEKNDHKTYNSSMFSLYIQMEYCAGTLEHFMEQFDECASFISNINSDKILTPVYYHIYCKLFEELIQCVDYLHRQNKIHRDLRPANILIPREINGKFIKIGDFGLVTCHDFKSKSHSKVKADLKYVAPEIERGEDHNVKADIYSLGRMMGLLFRVDNYVDHQTSMSSKYNSLKQLIEKMVKDKNFEGHNDFDSRPSCRELLRDKDSWFLEMQKMDIESKLENLEKKLKSNEKLNDSFLHSFVQHISKSKSIKEIPSKNRYEEEFEEIKLIATGGYGLVYAVRHKLDKIDYAIKIIDLNKIGNDGIAMKETQTLAKLDNEFIVRYKSSWVENKIDRDVYYIQMELCDGNLRDLMDQVNQDSNLKKVDILSLIGYYFCTHIMEEIFEGVNYLHKLSPIIIHRDLKPSNILIKFILNGKVIRIADFSSVANHGFSDQSHTDDRGTPKYMAPEVISNRNYDEKADIYSLGIIWSKLFDVDMNREYNHHESGSKILMSKYSSTRDFCIQMTRSYPHKRPDCEKILNARSTWGLNAGEFDFQKELKIISSKTYHNRNDVDSFIYNFIISKLTHYEITKPNLSFSQIFRKLFKL